MISKRKRNTILVYCMASVVMLCALASNVTKVTTSMKTNSKKIVAENHSVETTEVSYGLVAIEASSSIEENKDAQNVTEKKEEKKEEAKEESSNKTDKDKTESSTSNKASSSNKATSNKTTSNKTKSNKTTSNKATSNNTNSNKKSNNTSNGTTSNTTTNSNSNTTNSSKGVEIANYAKKFVGKSYRMGGSWNGEMPYTATDCSGFTQGVFKHFGISLPRVARDQATVGKKVSFSELQPGDLVFYSGNGGKSVTHVAIYIGNGKIVHAQTPSLGIGITTYNIMVKMTARRVI